MTAKGSIVSGSIPDRILTYLTQNPGARRAPEIAAALGLPVQKVANIAGRMARQNHLQRVTWTQSGKVRGVTVFALPGHTITVNR